VPNISRHRGDTFPIILYLTDEDTGRPFPIPGGSTFLFTVNGNASPTDASDQVFQSVGEIVNASLGSVRFPVDPAAADILGTFYHDAQMTGPTGLIRTVDHGEYVVEQDITKEGFYGPAMVWNVEGEAIGSPPTNVFDTWGEDEEVRLIPVDGKEPLTPFTKEVWAKAGNPTYYGSVYITLDVADLGINLDSGRFRFEAVLRNPGWGVDGNVSLYFHIGEDQWYPEFDDHRMLVAAVFDSGHHWTWVQPYPSWVGQDLYEHTQEWAEGFPQIGYYLYQCEVDFIAKVYKDRIVGHWAGDQGGQATPWLEFNFPYEFDNAEMAAQQIEVWVGNKNNVDEHIMLTQVWLGPITDPFPGGEVLTSNYGV
jgi:hypothetical protein